MGGGVALSTSCSQLFGNFQLVEQLSVHRATFKFLCLHSHSNAPAASGTIKKCRM